MWKSTLIKMLYQNSDAYLYLDLQNLEDLNKLKEPLLFFRANQDVTICIDEMQVSTRTVFCTQKAEIDRYRHPGRFILLGSARKILFKNVRIVSRKNHLIELTPFTITETEQSTPLIYISFGFVEGIPIVTWQHQTGEVYFGEKTSLEHMWKGHSAARLSNSSLATTSFANDVCTQSGTTSEFVQVR